MSKTESESKAAIPQRLAVPLAAGTAVIVLIGSVAFVAAQTAPIRGAVRSYAALIAAANRGDLAAARELCTEQYLANHPIQQADEGGLVGLPRGIHKNFRAWFDGADVLICPTDPRERVRPVYRLVEQGGRWKFDGLAGQWERSR